jgi:hypothetical protein
MTSDQPTSFKTAPTPGPWTTYRLSRDSDPLERLIVVTADGETEISGIIPNQADAGLIAAAPELLAALKIAIATADPAQHKWIAEARAVIARR